MRHTVLFVLGITAAAAGSFACCRAMSRRVAAQDVLVSPWVEQQVDAVTVSVPWPLQRRALPIGDEERKTLTAETAAGHAEAALSVLVSHFAYAAGQQPSLDMQADRTMTELKRIDPKVEGKTFQTQLAGAPAMEVEAKLINADGAPSYAHAVFLSDKSDTYELIMMCSADQPRAGDVWQKLRSSLKRRPA